MNERRRNSLRLSEYDYGSSGAYFVTVCARRRECILGTVVGGSVQLTRVGELVEERWRMIPEHHPEISADALIVMPNHAHGTLLLGVGAGYIPPLHVVVGTFKAAVTRAAGTPVWQRGYHDRVIRNETELSVLREYIETNPLRWVLDRENSSHGRPARRP